MDSNKKEKLEYFLWESGRQEKIAHEKLQEMREGFRKHKMKVWKDAAELSKREVDFEWRLQDVLKRKLGI